jgi:hypothetical protein
MYSLERLPERLGNAAELATRRPQLPSLVRQVVRTQVVGNSSREPLYHFYCGQRLPKCHTETVRPSPVRLRDTTPA